MARVDRDPIANYDPDELLRRVRYATELGGARWG
jgi:hypothetical protein